MKHSYNRRPQQQKSSRPHPSTKMMSQVKRSLARKKIRMIKHMKKKQTQKFKLRSKSQAFQKIKSKKTSLISNLQMATSSLQIKTRHSSKMSFKTRMLTWSTSWTVNISIARCSELLTISKQALSVLKTSCYQLTQSDGTQNKCWV